MRVDKWLWFTRFFKTRTLAGKAVAGGHVKINGTRARPSSKVSPGDLLVIVRDQLTYRLTASVLPVRRGSADEARLCYTEACESICARQKMQEELRLDRRQMPRTPGRPDKHTRRKLRERNRSTD